MRRIILFRGGYLLATILGGSAAAQDPTLDQLKAKVQKQSRRAP
ncbi:MAG TPA: hypothetical protein VIU65_11980 [Pyrinomonadaceae bacterium]